MEGENTVATTKTSEQQETNEQAASLIEKKKKSFKHLSETAVVFPKKLVETRTWQTLSSNAKEVYRVITYFYDYESGLSKATHKDIQNESGIGARATIVKAIRELEGKKVLYVIEARGKNKIIKHHYILPYQEEYYAFMTGMPKRDFLAVHEKSLRKTTRRLRKKGTVLPENIHPLFFRTCQKLITLNVDAPEKVLYAYADRGEELRTISFLLDMTYLLTKGEIDAVRSGVGDPLGILLHALDRGDVREELFGEEVLAKARALIQKRKEQTVTS